VVAATPSFPDITRAGLTEPTDTLNTTRASATGFPYTSVTRTRAGVAALPGLTSEASRNARLAGTAGAAVAANFSGATLSNESVSVCTPAFSPSLHRTSARPVESVTRSESALEPVLATATATPGTPLPAASVTR